MRPKNWSSFQHYKNRRPPWIRLYHSLLDEPEFWDMKGDDFRYLTAIWLIASESEDGELPDTKKLAFRLRLSVKAATEMLARLKDWLSEDASKYASGASKSSTDQGKVATPEERRGETEERRDGASAPSPDPSPDPADSWDAGPEANIPEGLSVIQYRQFVCDRLGAADTNAKAFESAIRAIAREENESLAGATRLVIERGRANPPNDGNWWKWVSNGAWKQQGVSTEGWE